MAIKDNIDDDRYQPLELPPVPKNVVRFARLCYLSLWLDVPGFYLWWSTLTDAPSLVPLGLLVELIVVPLFIWLIRAVTRRRRAWAREVLLLLFIGGIFLWPSVVWRSFEKSPALAAIKVAQALLQLAALRLIYSKSATQWLPREKVPSLNDVH